MANKKNVDKKIPAHLISKRNELIWALSVQHEYNNSEIGLIMNLYRSTILRIIKNRPKGWTPKWKKVRD